MENQKKMCRVFISDFVENMDLIRAFIQIKNDFPDYFNSDVSQLGLYGSFSYCIWSKKNYKNELMNSNAIEENLRFCMDNALELMLDFSNTALNKDYFYDLYSNYVLNLIDKLNMKIQAVVSNHDLALYLADKYSNIDFVYSNYEKRNIVENSIYSSILVDNEGYCGISQTDKNAIMYLNSFCQNCYSCVENDSQATVNFQMPVNNCDKKFKTFQSLKSSKLFVSKEKRNELVEKGVQDYIICLNTSEKYEKIEAIIYYLIKNEYMDEVRLMLMKRLY